MSASQNVKAVNLIAGEDLRVGASAGGVYSALKFENDSGVGKVIKAVAATDVIVGFLAEEPRTDVSTDGFGVPVVVVGAGGVGKAIASGAITAGEVIVASTTAGQVASVANPGALAVDQMGIGYALQSAVAGDIFEVLVMTVSAPHTA